MRTPCCEKMGLKKGPWTAEEDQILISYIQRHGHENWRALPKQAGLLRCGKSCRLRWTNYLRPDIKRGNFSKEEEETIIKLHQVLGNRWSTIATRLPGRTDNEIKNFWNTHLKKRLKQNPVIGRSNQSPGPVNFSLSHLLANQPIIPTQKLPKNFSISDSQTAPNYEGQCTNVSDHQRHPKRETKDTSVISATSKFMGVLDPRIRINLCSSESTNGNPNSINNCDMAFWYNLLIRSGESQNMNNQEM